MSIPKQRLLGGWYWN